LALIDGDVHGLLEGLAVGREGVGGDEVAGTALIGDLLGDDDGEVVSAKGEDFSLGRGLRAWAELALGGVELPGVVEVGFGCLGDGWCWSLGWRCEAC